MGEINLKILKNVEFVRIPLLSIGTSKFRTGTSFHQSDFKSEGTPLIKIGNMKNQKIDFTNTDYVVQKKENLTSENDLLIAMRGGTTGKLSVVDKESSGCHYVGSIGNFGPLNTDLVWQPYLKYIQLQLYNHFIEGTKGTATPMVSIEMLKKIKISIPSTIENQKKVYECLEKLLCQIDYLKDKIDEQYSYITQLRQSILQEAIEGKLTAEWRASTTLSLHQTGNEIKGNPDFDAVALLEVIKKEKAKLIAEGKLKKEKPLPVIEDSEKPFELPEGWVWCRLEDFGFLCGGGTPSTERNEYWNGEIPWICPKDMKHDIISDSIDKITELGLNESSAKLIPENSILFVVRGMILVHTFPVAINDRPASVNQDMKALITFKKEMNSYIITMLKGYSKRILNLTNTSTHGTKRLEYAESYAKLKYPLPPLAEQQVIVERVDSLLAMVDVLEKQVNERKVLAEELMQSVLREAFEVV